MWFQITAPHFVAGIEIDKNKKVISAAPIIVWTLGKQWADVNLYFRKKDWKVKVLSSCRTQVININHARLHNGDEELVMIGRGSKWGNPFKIGVHGDRKTVLAKYYHYILYENPELLEDLGELQGKTLGCYCKPEGCHGDILMYLMERRMDEGLLARP